MSSKVQQSVCADCVTYEKSRIDFNNFNTFNNVDDDDSEVFFEFIHRHEEMIREEVKRDIERCFEEIKNLQS